MVQYAAMKTLFSSIAARYDRMNRVMSLALDRRWRRAALAAATLPPSGAVLDLACGTGDFTGEILRCCPGTEVVGVDLTPEMLDIARRKLAGAGNVRFQTGDAQDLHDIPSGSFGLVVCAFGFRNFPDKAKALAECRRVLTPGGELLVLELFRPTSRPLGFLVNAWLAAVTSVFARGAREEYAYLRRSISGTVDADGFVALAREAGFTPLRRRFFLPSATCLVLKPDSSAPAAGIPS